MEEEKQEKEWQDTIKEQVEKQIKTLTKTGVNANNIEYLYKLIDVHKDLANETYWKEKINMYREGYGNYSGYGNYEGYGARGVPGTGRGRYREGSYGRRGVPGSGRGRYRGEEVMEEMAQRFGEYSDNRDLYHESGSYGAKEDSKKALEYMLKSVEEFMTMLEEEAGSEEEIRLIKKTAKKISEK